MSAIFLSYRPADAGGHAGRLWDRLRLCFDPEALFYDQGRIESGEVFPERIQQALDAAKVVLVLIGPGWQRILAERAEGSAIDWVWREVEIALKRRLETRRPAGYPGALGRAERPSAETLPEGLAPCANWRCIASSARMPTGRPSSSACASGWPPSPGYRRRVLQEQVLALSRRVLGAEHPDTSVSAFNLLSTLLEVGEPELARCVHPLPRVAAGARSGHAGLGADQRLIRDRLAGLVGHDHPSGTE